MVDYIDTYKDEYGIEPICSELPIAPSTYHAFKSRLPSARSVRDALLMPLLLGLFIDNFKVYGARKLWKAAGRAGHDVGRDQVARLMRQMGIHGVNRRRPCSSSFQARSRTWSCTCASVRVRAATCRSGWLHAR